MTTRISGISSGIDTESIIRVLVEAQQQPITRLEERKTDDEEKLTQWSELATAISDVRSVTNQLTSYSTWRQMTTSSSDSTKLTATVSGLSVDAAAYNFNITKLAVAHTVWGSSQATGALGYTGSFVINGETIDVAASDTLSNIKDAINTASENMDSDHKIRAYIVDNQLVMENKKTGTGYDIVSSDSVGTVLQSLGILNGVGAYVNETASDDLTGTVNSVAISSKSNTGITDILDGITLNFKDTGTVTLDVERDTSTIKSLIQDFITKYNDAMSLAKMQGTVQLSDTGELSALGKLQGDTLLSTIQNGARSILTTVITDPALMDQNYNTLYKIGIGFASEDNQISIMDEEKLDDALLNHFEEVEDLFRSYGTVRQNGRDGEGILRQLDSFLYAQIDPINGNITNRKSTLESNITNINTEIYQMNQDLIDYENDLWEHFARMEDAVGEIQSQGNYMMSALGMG